MPRISVQDAGGINFAAFLDMIAFGEIGPSILAQSDDGYNVLVGSRPGAVKTFDSYATHPNIYSRASNSTAAGRYQLLFRFFKPYQMQLKLPDFEPVSQDRIALQMIKEQKAVDAIATGHIDIAVQRCGNIWASLPGSRWGQRTDASPSIEQFIAAYKAAGGLLT